MLSIDEILEKTVLIRYNFKAWRRNGLQLLPKPVSVDKKNILFDDSILERIKLIGDQQAALMVYTTIISNSIVHFVEVYVDLYDPRVLTKE